ncbi:hypothetical protein [Pseudoneobacillus sp. C159]
MVGNLRFNFIIGVAAWLGTFLFSLPNNTWQTSLFRGLIGFFIFFIFSYFIRSIIHIIISMKDAAVKTPEQEKKAEDLRFAETDEIEQVTEDIQDDDSMFQSIPLHSLHKEAGLNRSE